MSEIERTPRTSEESAQQLLEEAQARLASSKPTILVGPNIDREAERVEVIVHQHCLSPVELALSIDGLLEALYQRDPDPDLLRMAIGNTMRRIAIKVVSEMADKLGGHEVEAEVSLH